MSFPQLGFPQFLSASSHEVYAGERPGSAREGAADSASPSASAAALSSMLGMYGNPWAHSYSAFLPYGGAADLAVISQMVSHEFNIQGSTSSIVTLNPGSNRECCFLFFRTIPDNNTIR